MKIALFLCENHCEIRFRTHINKVKITPKKLQKADREGDGVGVGGFNAFGQPANISFLLITPETAGFQPMTPGTIIKRSNHLAVRQGKSLG